MTTEQTGDGSPQPDEKSLIVRSEQTSLQAMTDKPFLQVMGFSPQLPQHLMDLNTVLLERGPAIESVGIELIPGETPLVSTQIEHGPGYRVHLNSKGSTASLNIADMSKSHNPSLVLLLADIQNFARSTFTDQKARLQARKKSLKSNTIGSYFDEDLYSVTDEMIKPWVDVTRNDDLQLYEECEVRIGDQVVPLLTLDPDARYHIGARSNDDRAIVFKVRRFQFEGTPEQVERMLEPASRLFDKPHLYPYRFEDVPKVE